MYTPETLQTYDEHTLAGRQLYEDIKDMYGKSPGQKKRMLTKLSPKAKTAGMSEADLEKALVKTLRKRAEQEEKGTQTTKKKLVKKLTKPRTPKRTVTMYRV